MSSHVKNEQLYPLFHLLSLHQQKKKSLAGLPDFPDELQKTLERLDHYRFEKEPAEEHAVKPERVKEIVGHLNSCENCQIMVYEDGPTSKRTLSKEEIAAESDKEEERIRKLKQKFFISVGYSVPSLIGGRMLYQTYLGKKPKASAVNEFKAVNQAKFTMDPLLIGAGALILVAAWGLVQCWEIANEVWLDWSKAKEAVPFIGKAWAEKSRKAKENEGRGKS